VPGDRGLTSFTLHVNEAAWRPEGRSASSLRSRAARPPARHPGHPPRPKPGRSSDRRSPARPPRQSL